MKSKLLQSETLPVAALADDDARKLFALFVRHYEHVDWPHFERDLREKDFLILLREVNSGAVRGFSTQKIMHVTVGAELLRVLFSGDTIIDPAFWGEQELVRAWCRFAGQMRAAEPNTRLFWFLISKGYRTYLYLPLFFREFFPRRDCVTPPFAQQTIDALGFLKYPDHYNPLTGLLEFGQSQGNLTPGLAAIPAARREDPHVKFFLERNPRYADGHELLCLAEISPANMKSFAARFVAEAEALAARPSSLRTVLLPPASLATERRADWTVGDSADSNVCVT